MSAKYLLLRSYPQTLCPSQRLVDSDFNPRTYGLFLTPLYVLGGGVGWPPQISQPVTNGFSKSLCQMKGNCVFTSVKIWKKYVLHFKLVWRHKLPNYWTFCCYFLYILVICCSILLKVVSYERYWSFPSAHLFYDFVLYICCRYIWHNQYPHSN